MALAALTACASYDSHTIQYVGVPRPAPTDANRIEILHSPPSRPHERLGEVVIHASIDPAPPIARIEARLRREAAKLGADAVLLVHDRTETTGFWMTGPYWSPSVSGIQSRITVGVAIRYTDRK